MATKKEIENIAKLTGFQEGPIEKVLYLRIILKALSEHEDVSNSWVLKGGTALNLFFLNMPRLSVDIDLNFTGASNVDELPRAREQFEKILVSLCERERCDIKKIPDSHAGGKFRLKYPSIFGRSGNLEIDVNYLIRTPLLGVQYLESCFPPKGIFTDELKVRTLSFEEIAAGKFSALLDRFAARDVFDAINILELNPTLLSSPSFRAVLISYLASNSKDIRGRNHDRFELDSKEVKDRLLPLLSIKDDKSADQLLEKTTSIVIPAIKNILNFNPSENKFFDLLFNQGKIESNLLSEDPGLCDLISNYPPLLWRSIQVLKSK